MLRFLLIAGCSLFLSSASYSSDQFPTKPIKVIIPFPAGGPVDVLGRGLGEYFRKRTGQGFIVEARPGANTAIAGTACKDAANDGYTLCLLASTTVSINPHLFTNLRYTAADFTPVSNVAISRAVMLVHRDVPVNTLKELIAYSVKYPEKMNYGSFGAGSETNLIMEWMKRNTKASITHVPFQGLVPALQAFDRGDIQIFMPTATQSTMDMIGSGKAKPLMVLSDQPSDKLPNTPTIPQSGLPPLGVQTWFGMLAPVGIPVSIAEKVSSEIRSIVADKEFSDRFITSIGLIPEANTPAEFASFLKQDRESAAALVAASGIKLRTD